MKTFNSVILAAGVFNLHAMHQNKTSHNIYQFDLKTTEPIFEN